MDLKPRTPKKDWSHFVRLLEILFKEGRKISIRQIILEPRLVGKIRNDFERMVVEKVVRSTIGTLKHLMWNKHRLKLGVVDKKDVEEVDLINKKGETETKKIEHCRYGIILTDEESMFRLNRLFALNKGIYKSMKDTVTEVEDKGLLKGRIAHENWSVPRVGITGKLTSGKEKK